MTTVKIIKQRGQSALVEYLYGDHLRRVNIPTSSIKAGQVEEGILEMGIPYGLEWSNLLSLQATPELFQENLRQAGIWTKDDALKNPQLVVAAIQATYQIDLAKIFSILKED